VNSEQWTVSRLSIVLQIILPCTACQVAVSGQKIGKKGEIPDFSGDFQGSNLTMWDNLGLKIFHRR